MSPSWLGFTVTHLWKHDLYPLCFSLSRSWSSVAESNFRWNVHFFHPPLMCPVPLRTVQLFLLFPCPPVSCSSDAALCTAPLCLCSYMSPCTSRSASPPILHARKLHSHARSDKLKRWWRARGGGTSLRQLIVFRLNEELKVAHHFPSALQRCSHWIHL